MRGLLLAGALVCMAVAVLVQSREVTSTQTPDDFWRLPWVAGASRNVGAGNGYGDSPTHAGGNDRYALDFQIPLGFYVTSAQEGMVTNTGSTSECTAQGYGVFVEITDLGGFKHLYAHLENRAVSTGDYVLAGWAIGRSGASGHVIPCGAVHLHYRITHPSACSASGVCVPEPLSRQCADWSYVGASIYCAFQGPAYTFSYDPSADNPAWKDVYHVSNNAGVGNKPSRRATTCRRRW